MEDIHDRMPAFLHPTEFEQWLHPDTDDALLVNMLNPYPVDVMDAHIVSKAVGSVSNNYPGLTKKAELF